MGFTRKIFESARSGLGSLLDKVSTDETPLSHVDRAELDAELAARKAARKSAPEPKANPRAKYADASPASEAAREKQAKSRSATVNARRTKQQKAREQANEEAFRRAQESAQREARRTSGRRPSGSAAGGQQRRRQANPRRGEPDIADHYKTLNLPPTASLTEAKRAFRKLMRKYHPDLAPANKKKAATELTMRITAAYKAIEEYHSGK